MANNMSQYLAQKILDAVMRNQTYTPPSSVWIALFNDTTASAALLDAGTLTGELSGDGYLRVNKNSTHFNAATTADPSVVTNNGVLAFAPASGTAWETVKFMAVMDSDTGGTNNVLFYAQLQNTKDIGVGETFQFLDTDLSISLT